MQIYSGEDLAIYLPLMVVVQPVTQLENKEKKTQ